MPAIARTAVAAFVACVAAQCAPARAGDWSLTGLYAFHETGKMYQYGKGHAVWLAEGYGTFFNDKGDGSLLDKAGSRYSEYGDLDLEQKTVSFSGKLTLNDGRGNEAYLDWHCKANELPPVRCEGAFDWLGGTGRFAGISGHARFTANPLVHWDDGSISGYSTWGR